MEVITNKGIVRLPSYLPVTTFGTEFPLDKIVRPFLPRFADMLMVSYGYAVQMDEEQELPVFIDSGGFALLLDGSEMVVRANGMGEIHRNENGVKNSITPEGVLELQREKAQWGSTLDFPIPPSMEGDCQNQNMRMEATLANAKWAIESGKEGGITLFGSVQGWDLASYVKCAKSMVQMGFKDLALGGFVPRVAQKELLLCITKEVKRLMHKDGMLHIFGMGEPEFVRALFGSGATSVDSSSYIRAAASGKRWDGGWTVEGPSGLERAHMAIGNLKYALEAVNQTSPEKCRHMQFEPETVNF